MSKLDDILINNPMTYDAGKNKLMFSIEPTKQQIKDLIFEIIKGEPDSYIEYSHKQNNFANGFGKAIELITNRAKDL